MADRRRPNIVVLVVIAMAVIALAAVLVGGRGRHDDATTSSGSPSSTASGTQHETGTVHITGTVLPPFRDASDDPAVGAAAPTVTGTTFAGDAVSIGEGPTLLVFIAHWCPHCQREVPRLVDWFGGGVPGGASIQAVATSISADRPNYPPSSWLTREHWTFPTLVDDADSTAAQAYGLTAFPYFVGIDANGKVVARQSGELDRDGVDALLSAVTK